MLVEKLRNLWQFSAVCEFVTLFGEALRIPELDLLKFEEELAKESEDGSYLREVRLSLIRSLSSNRTINIENMDEFIRRQYTYRRVMPNPLLLVERVWKESFPDSTSDGDHESDDSDLGDVEEVEQQTFVAWLDLSVQERVRVLHDLCEWQLQSDKFRDRVGANTELQMSQWRILPIGQDAERQLYYLLSDGRLYRCDHPAMHISNATANKKRKRGQSETSTIEKFRDGWTCIAATYDEWQSVVKELDQENGCEEEQLLKYLVHTALPYVEEVENERLARLARLKAKEEKLEADRIKELLRQELLSTRKRSSRIATMDEKREAERLRQEEALRIQELEKRAHLLAQQEDKNVHVVSYKTREARARERELREFIVSNQESPVPNDKDTTLEATNDGAQTPDRLPAPVTTGTSSLVNGDQVRMKEPGVELATNMKNNCSNQAESTLAQISPPRAQMVVREEDSSWINRHAAQMTQGIDLDQALVSATVSNELREDEFPRDFPKTTDQYPVDITQKENQTLSSNAAAVHVDPEDAGWVNHQANMMSRGIPLAHDPVTVSVQPHDDSQASSSAKA